MTTLEARGQSFSPADFTREHSVDRPSILALPDRLARLQEPDRRLVERFFEISTEGGNGTSSQMVIPASMEPWVLATFGNGQDREETMNSVQRQEIVHVQDRLLKTETVVNLLRTRRPQPTTGGSSFQRDIDDPTKKQNCPFCSPEENTPYDSETGRLFRNGTTTAVNITKFAPDHSLALGKHNPYETEKDQFRDQIALLLDWARQKFALDSARKFLRIGLNRGYRAAGTQVHDHWQAELRPGSMHFPYAERLNEVAYNYRRWNHQGSNFLDDYSRAHQVLGLGIKTGSIEVFSMLVPPKEHGVMIIDGDGSGGFEISQDFIKALWEVQQFMLEAEDVREYNIFILPRPHNPDNPEYWSQFRTIGVFVDRGHSKSPSSDWGYAELSGTAVISYDPFDFGPRLNKHLLSKI